jgi:pimeloyl-ACP methyl ester carboxylesterase
MQVTERQVKVNGVTLAARDRGSGPAVVLVQPGLLTGDVFEDLAIRLTERFRVVTFDSRGHGRSTNPDGELSYALLADDTAALIDALGLQHPFVGGWSDGREVALQLALRHPGVARAVIAGGISLEMGESERARQATRRFFHASLHNDVDIAAFAADNESGLLSLLRQSHPDGEAQWQDVVRWSAWMWLTYAGLSQDEARRIEVPVLVVVGDEDEDHPLPEVIRLLRWLPNAELAILPGCDHMRPIFDPATLAAVMVDFLERH